MKYEAWILTFANRQYSLNVPITGKGTFPSQCTSLLTSGQTLTYESTTPNGPWGIVTSTVPASTAASTGPTIVYGMHVNGFNVLAAATTMSSSSSTITSVTTPLPSNSSAPQTTSSATSNGGSSSSALSKGAAAGIAVGVVLVVVLIAIVGWFLFSRSRKGRQEEKSPFAMTSQELPAEPRRLNELDGSGKTFELGT